MATRFKGLALTFSDILLEPAKSRVAPNETKLETQLTKKIKLNTPFVSSASDTVTDHSMAEAMARMGGIGIIHRNLSVEDQSHQVRLVKRAESSLIRDPITLRPESSLQEALEVMTANNISGVPVVNDSHLKGILTGRDLRFEDSLNKKVGDVMTKEGIISVKVGVSLEQAERLLKKHKIEKLPVVDGEGKLKGLITWKDLNKRKESSLAVRDKLGRLLVGAAIGVGTDMLKRASLLVKEGVDVLVIDTAHGHHQNVLQAVPLLKKAFPKVEVVAGNVATAEATKELIKRGADAVKVGVGAGSICITRDVAGAGVPQFTAILECAKVAGKNNIPLIADGGVVYPSDLVKALAAGASTVMMGNILAGTDEAPGDVIVSNDGRRYKSYRGMGSFEAIKVRGHDRYFRKDVAEGISARVPYKGSVREVGTKLSASLKTSMGYYGAYKIQDLWKTSYWQITSAGIKESHTHSVLEDLNISSA